MTPVEWTAIVALVGGAVELARVVAAALIGAGCPVEGCPPDERARLPIPDVSTPGRAARKRALRRGT